MALTKATLIDLNANELILDSDADTSITADSDDTIDFKIGGSDEIKMTTTALTPAVADGSALGTAALEWADLFLADAAVISLGADQDVTLTHVHNEGLLLNSTMKLEFNDASQFVQGSSATVLSIGATDEIDLTATLIDINGNLDVSGTITIGNAAITEAELEQIDGITAGTALASKALIADANIDITGLRNVTATGTITATGFTIGSAAITETELEILDGASVSTTELNYLDITTLGTSEASKAVTVDSSGDLIVPDSDKYKFGAGSDMQLYHDGTNSYITNATGALKIATETSGIAITIGHSTSQVTIADNLTVAGDMTVTGTQTIQNTVTMNAQNAVVFEGATADANETTLTIVDPTADHTVYMPNATGYLPVLSAASTTVITATPTELNYVDGVTSAIQTQLDTKTTKAFAIAQAVALG